MKRLFRLFLWILFFPFMLTYWGWKNGRKSVAVIGAILSFVFILIGFSGQESTDDDVAIGDNPVIESSVDEEIGSGTEMDKEEEALADSDEDAAKVEPKEASIPSFDGYTLIEVDGGDLSGVREANVVVDIGYGDREYWAFTNEHGQLVKVVADEIILQDDSSEPVTSEGKYYSDEAKVLGTEDSEFDESHVIADSLGGVSNAYNITPQSSGLNRYGDQAYMEKVIRDAGGCTDFVARISYPDTVTQIPSHYSYTYTLRGKVVSDEFANVDPDAVNEELAEETSEGENLELGVLVAPVIADIPDKQAAVVEEEPEAAAVSAEEAEEAQEVEVPEEVKVNNMGSVEISALNKKAEYIVIQNTGENAVDLSGWWILSVKGGQSFTFPKFTLQPGASVKVGDSAKNDVDFHWLDGKGTWNNSEKDPAELYNAAGELVDRYED